MDGKGSEWAIVEKVEEGYGQDSKEHIGHKGIQRWRVIDYWWTRVYSEDIERVALEIISRKIEEIALRGV